MCTTQSVNMSGSEEDKVGSGENNFEMDENGHWSCKKCPKSFITRVVFKYHLSATHGLDLVTLLEQQQILSEDSDQHQAIHEKQCQKSNQSNEIKSTVDNQLNTHLHQCQECQKYFGRNDYLQYHINTVHKKLTPYKCQKCQRVLRGKIPLQTHINSVHEQIKHFKCNICKRGFGLNSTLQYHINAVHENKLPLKCDRCNKTFGRKSLLQSHINFVHEKLIAYQCQECNKCFERKSGFNTHVKRAHSKQMPI